MSCGVSAWGVLCRYTVAVSPGESVISVGSMPIQDEAASSSEYVVFSNPSFASVIGIVFSE